MRILGKYFGIIWLLVSALVYASVLISPLHFQYASIVSFAIPIMMVLSIVLFFLTIFSGNRFWFLYLLASLLAWPYYQVVYQFEKESPLKGEVDFEVLSFNVKRFNGLKSYENESKGFLQRLDSISILCFQEFSLLKDHTKMLKKYYSYRDGYANSIATFSKFPIVNKGIVFKRDGSVNNVIFCDLEINNDTIRIYNAHLESMGINPEKLQDSEGIRSEYDNVKFRILRGSRARAEQVKVLMEHVNNSPYPVVIAGDFNDVPFSYNYFKLKEGLNNAFEEGGSGFGITYNGKIPFLRIDNQFFGEGIEILQFQTLSDVYYSDHFPLMGEYRITD